MKKPDKQGPEHKRAMHPLLPEWVARDILKTSDRRIELEQLGVDTYQLAYPVALAIYHRDRWEAVNKKTARAREALKKARKRYRKTPKDKYSRERHLNALADARTKVGIAKAEAARIKGDVRTKKRPYLHELIVELEKILKPKTKRPYHYIAALFNLFNLHPERFCEECEGFDPKQDRCQLVDIFTCPKHRKVTDKIGQMARRTRQAKSKLTSSR